MTIRYSGALPHLLRSKDVRTITKMGRTTIHNKVKDGSFPAPLRIGKRAIAWEEQAIRDWLESLTTNGQGGA